MNRLLSCAFHGAAGRLCRLTPWLLAVLSWPAAAHAVSDATRLGAFAGAMQFCEQRHEGPTRRYRWARLQVAREIGEMQREDRLRALMARDRARERGRFLGNRLDQHECEALLRLSEWERFRQP